MRLSTESTPIRVKDVRRTSTWRDIVTILRRWPVVPLLIIIVILIFAIFAPWIAPYDPTLGGLALRNIPPAWSPDGSSMHILGTDPLGRDILSRIIYGARISLMVAGTVLIVGTAGGTALGLISGYFGGNTDELIMRLVDFTLAVPFILVALVVVIVFGQSLQVIIVLLVIFSWNTFARQARAETLQLKSMDYVRMARVTGASNFRIMSKHIFPGLINTIVVIASLRVGTLILTEATLSFLGMGIPPPTPAWGLMVSDGRDYIATAWWVSFFPGVAIFLTVLATSFLGDWLRDRLDPTLRHL